MIKRLLVITAVIAPVALLLAPVATADETPSPAPLTAPSRWIVQLTEPPIVVYRGGEPGYAPTARQGRNERRQAAGTDERAYGELLRSRHDQVLARVGGTKLYDYSYSFNGFAAELTGPQAESLRRTPGVLSVSEDRMVRADTDTSPSFLGLSQPGGLWDQLGGQGAAGEDVVVGIIDSGIWPEHSSLSDQADLADRPGRTGDALRVYDRPEGWYGICQRGERWARDDCNGKLIGARYFVEGIGRRNVVEADFLSPRDAEGHGTHVASTAAGNAGVAASVLGSDLGLLSGMAPRARVAAYKALWNAGVGNEGVGAETDLVAAIDAAVADGVDVLNMSFGSATPTLFGPQERATLFATEAGVFVAQSAGNTGPEPGTIGDASVPWTTSVAAGTHDRSFRSLLTLGQGGGQFEGASVTGAVSPRRLVDAAHAGRPGVDPVAAELCTPGTLDPGAVTDAIVLCLRGEFPPLEKSYAVLLAGGAGMVLYEPPDRDDIFADNHFVPTIHVDNPAGLAVKAYIAASGRPRAAIGDPYPAPTEGSVLAVFSSRGPNQAASDVLKPDIVAPGVDILAGHTPENFLSSGAPGQLFRMISGTSMASPHVAGVAALLVQQHPDWSPAMIKSALMTSASPDVLKEDGATPAVPFDAGAGYLHPNGAAGPGLVYDADFDDYVAFLCGNGNITTAGCADLSAKPIDPSDLNLPSVAVGELAGRQTVTRTVTNVSGVGSTYRPAVTGLEGIEVEVVPDRLRIPAGGSATYSVTFTTAGAPVDQYSFGGLAWTDGSHVVRIPIAVQPISLAAPSSLALTGTEGSTGYEVSFGFTGPFAAVARGLVPALTAPGEVEDDPGDDVDAALLTGVGVRTHDVLVPEGTRHARFSLFDEYVGAPGGDDLDLYVLEPSGDPAGFSASASSAEQVDLVAPSPGTYTIIVHGYETAASSTTYTLFTWNLGDAAVGNLTVTAPTTASTGARATIGVAWSGLEPGGRYLGAVTHHDTAAPESFFAANLATTLVSVYTDLGAPAG